jgi:radical SAM protein with 4Fe4S-binding SPASM domain
MSDTNAYNLSEFIHHPRYTLQLQESLRVNHPLFGDLTRTDAVCMTAEGLHSKDNFKEEDDIIINLTVTGRCYARCEGCINSAITFASDGPRNPSITNLESDPEYDASIVIRLAQRHLDSMVTLAFYGGEPFLATDKMEKVRLILAESEIKNRVRYMVYTNGELLSQACKHYPSLISNMWLYSVSIDGDEEQHRQVRPGTDLNLIIVNLRKLRSVYQGNVLFWSTLREQQSLRKCFHKFLELYREGLVNHFFWHWADTKDPYQDLTSYVKRYGAELEEVMEQYVVKAFQGEILPIIHLNELILYLISGKQRGHTACGVELARNYDIMGGEIHACADLPPSVGGSIDRTGSHFSEPNFTHLVEYKNWLKCYECRVYPYCGGRCLVQALSGSPTRTLQICQLMRLHVGIVRERIDDISTALNRNGISLQHLYDSSAYFTRYTDVVP